MYRPDTHLAYLRDDRRDEDNDSSGYELLWWILDDCSTKWSCEQHGIMTVDVEFHRIDQKWFNCDKNINNPPKLVFNEWYKQGNRTENRLPTVDGWWSEGGSHSHWMSILRRKMKSIGPYLPKKSKSTQIGPITAKLERLTHINSNSLKMAKSCRKPS